MIYLINPSEKGILDNAGDRMPIGLLSIGTKLESMGYDVKLYDLNHSKLNDLKNDISHDSNSIVGISVYTSPLKDEAIRVAKELRPYSKRLIAGGYHATAMPETLKEHFDAVVRGEGENSFNFAISQNGVITTMPPKLDKIPNINYGLLNMNKYGIEQSGKRTATMITSRGCPFHCIYCGKMERKVRFEPIIKIRKQMRDLKEYGFKSIYFLDDVFTLNNDRMEEITKFAKKIKMPFRVTTRADLLNESKLEILAKNGCEWISLGIESGSNKILKNAEKGMNVQQNYDVVQMAGKLGINVKGFFIIGLPGETEFTARQTINFAKSLKECGLKKADFYYLVPFPGTAIWQQPDEFRIKIKDRDYTKYLQAGKKAKCVVKTEGLSSERIEELVEEAKKQWKK